MRSESLKLPCEITGNIELNSEPEETMTCSHLHISLMGEYPTVALSVESAQKLVDHATMWIERQKARKPGE